MTIIPPANVFHPGQGGFDGGNGNGITVSLGYKQDELDERDLQAEVLLGAPGVTETIVPASMMKYRDTELLQGRASSCVAHALSRAIDMCLRYELELAGKGHIQPPKASRRIIYYNARRQEAVEAALRGQTAPQMADVGSFPRLAMRAVQKLGYCPEDLFPYNDTPSAIAEVPPPLAYRASIDQSGFRYARVGEFGNARVAEVARGLKIGKPSIFGMFVDSEFISNRGHRIERINTGDPNGGGHMLAVLEVTETDVIFDNWWGPRWGRGGLGYMSHSLFGSVVLSDVYMIETTPTFSAYPEENLA